jgi:hypothetical protein
MKTINKVQRNILQSSFRMALFDSIVAINPEIFTLCDSKEQALEAAIKKEAVAEIKKYKDEDLANLYSILTHGGRIEYDYETEVFTTIESQEQEEEEVSYGVAGYAQTTAFNF